MFVAGNGFPSAVAPAFSAYSLNAEADSNLFWQLQAAGQLWWTCWPGPGPLFKTPRWCVWGRALAAKGSFCFTISRCRKGNRLDFVESSLTYRKLADCWRVPRLFHGSPVLPSGGGVTCLAELVWTLLPTDILSPHESGLLELHVLWTLLQSMHPTTSPIAAPY